MICASLALLQIMFAVHRFAQGPPIGGQENDRVSNRRSALYTLCLFEAFPSRGNEKYGEEKQRVIYFRYHFGVFPLWWLAPPPFRPAGKRVTGFSVAYGSLRIQFPCHRKRWHNNPCLLQSRLRREASRCFILPPEQGEVRRSRIGGGERSEPIRRMLFMPYDIEN